MRITLDIDLDILDAARAMAESESKSLGFVISRLARRGLAPPVDIADQGMPHFRVDPGAPVFTAAMVRAAIEE